MIQCLVNGKESASYPEDVRKFSLRLQYYSTASFNFARSFFSNNLPSVRTLRSWYSSIDGSPGISSSALHILKEKAETYMHMNGHHLHVCLMYDEMHIRKDLSYRSESQSFDGFSTVTSSSRHDINDQSNLKLANESLVYMVVGHDFKLAVAYEFLDGLESEDRAALTLQVVKSIEEAGVKVISLTGDGINANVTTAEALGAKFDELKPYFQSPTYPQQKIYIIFDPPHMLKLVRKHFSSNMIYYEDRKIDWELLVKIVGKQSKDNFNLCNKLTKLHMNWTQKPMNVSLAAETLSKSVADVLLQLRNDGYEGFKNAEFTSEFIGNFNNAFDVLNFCKDSKSDQRYKQKVCDDTANNIFQFGEKFKEYISKLELRTKTKTDFILHTSAERGFFGFYIDFISLKGMPQNVVILIA